MSDILHEISRVCILVGVFSAMLAVGTGVPIGAVLRALRNPRVVGLALLANFVAVPLLAVGLTQVLPLSAEAHTAIILLGVAAGVPMLSRLTMLAHGNMPFSIGLMVLLMVGTVVYAPLALPRLLPHISVAAWDIAGSLSVIMLVPLVLGMMARQRYAGLADVSEVLAHIARPSMAIGIGAGVVAAWDDLVGTLGSGIFVGVLLLGLGGAAIGWLLAAHAPSSERRVAALGTAMRNFPAAIFVAGRDFDPDTLLMTSAGALILMTMTIILAGELGRFLPARPAASPTRSGA
jgi:predicted Na+-dependent transporter